MDSVRINEDPLTSDAVLALLQAHLDFCAAQSPICSLHAYDIAKLRAPGVSAWTAWTGADLPSAATLGGVGALAEIDATHGEIKSMHTAPAARGKGVADRLLTHIEAAAIARGYQRLSLETGSPPAFDPARRLYERHGFVECAPFADYVEDPFSVFMTKPLH